MKQSILLDTQVFIFALTSPDLIPNKIKRIISNQESEFYLSMASIWEMAIKASLGKLKFEGSIKDMVQTSVKETGLEILPIKAEHIYRIELMPFHHKDPFDRIIIAQAMVEKFSIMSSDSAFDDYEVKRLWK